MRISERIIPAICSLLPCCLLWAADALSAATPRTVDEWLQNHSASNFTGQVWARVKLLEPADAPFAVVIDGETNPYTPARRATGTVSAKGLKPRDWEGANDWGKPLAWYPPGDAEWLTNGQDSVWVALPVSKAREWFVSFIIKTRTPVADLSRFVLQLEFATTESETNRFRVMQEHPLTTGIISVRMPSEGAEKGLRMLESFREWTVRRAALVDSLKLGPPPKLTKFIFRSYLQLMDDRMVGGRLPRERVELDFRNFQQLGLNSIVVGNLDDREFEELARKYGIIHAMVACWAENWRYTAEAHSKQYDFLPGESVPDHWRRVFEDYYGKYAARLQKTEPYMCKIAGHVNLGDEIGPTVNAQSIRESPTVLAYFRQWLAEQGTTPQVKALGETWSPELFGAVIWEEVEPLDDPAERKPPKATPASTRRFYWTRRFMDHCTELFYGLATETVLRDLPQATSVDVNYQAGPMQMGFLGNDNTYETSSLDTLEMGRKRTFYGVKTEDWYGGNDMADGCCLFGAEILRGAARKHNLPLTVYLVGFEPYVRTWLYLMQGIREIDFYQYGPYSNIGPAWADHAPTLSQIGLATREVARYENLLATARRRPTKAAMLVAYTTDIMQAQGPGFGPERQQLYIALQHAGIPVDVIGENDITEDNRLKDYSLLYVCDPQVRTDVQEKIAAWVKTGGYLWAEAGAMAWDEYARLCTVMWEVFGVARIDPQTQTNWPWARPFYAPVVGRVGYQPKGLIKATTSDPSAPAAKAPAFSLPADVKAWGIRLNIWPVGCQVLAAYDDGEPAVIRNEFGWGQAVVVGALIGEAYAREHWPVGAKPEKFTFETGEAERALVTYGAQLAGIEPALQLSVPGLYTSISETPDATLVFLVNASKRPFPKLTVTLNNPGRVTRVESMKQPKLAHRLVKGRLVIDLPLQDVDVIFLRRK